MDEKEDILFNECKLQIIKTGRVMNVFSYVAAFGMAGLVLGGLLLIGYGSHIDADMPYYLEMLLSIGGIACILVSALLIPPVLFMRRAVHAAKQIAIENDMFPSTEYMRQTTRLWKYLTVFITAAFILAFFATLVVSLFVLSVRHAI